MTSHQLGLADTVTPMDSSHYARLLKEISASRTAARRLAKMWPLVCLSNFLGTRLQFREALDGPSMSSGSFAEEVHPPMISSLPTCEAH
jgi:hypothetical protein